MILVMLACVTAVLVPEFSAVDVGGGSVNVTWYWPPTTTSNATSRPVIAVFHRPHGTSLCWSWDFRQTFSVKLVFHDADTDTDTNILARK